jgi:hypothetical protein
LDFTFNLPPKSPIWGTLELRSLSFLGLILLFGAIKSPASGDLGGIKTGKTFQLLIRIIYNPYVQPRSGCIINLPDNNDLLLELFAVGYNVDNKCSLYKKTPGVLPLPPEKTLKFT